MPRSALRGTGAPLLSLSEGLNERALRVAAARASQQEGPIAAAADQVNVGGVVFNAFVLHVPFASAPSCALPKA